ncbi:MAG: hypothetical protein OQL05_01960 [Gammaproteobacteria bacterium]|nr:hypothetical protein [Gammaproteobacteria bacterium]MCW8972028.1 hypothetical protein [Gammaproteobacteria bacterium]MCW8991931.1 hypothetical protein [Gammaproteobacteria bacterium]
MIALKQTLQAWGAPEFNATFKKEVEALPPEQLPLQQGLSLSSSISDEPFRVMVISTGESEGRLQVKAGVFYSGIIAGCSCSDDPTPQDVQAEYCDLAFSIDPQSGETAVTLLAG